MRKTLTVILGICWLVLINEPSYSDELVPIVNVIKVIHNNLILDTCLDHYPYNMFTSSNCFLISINRYDGTIKWKKHEKTHINYYANNNYIMGIDVRSGVLSIISASKGNLISNTDLWRSKFDDKFWRVSEVFMDDNTLIIASPEGLHSLDLKYILKHSTIESTNNKKKFFNWFIRQPVNSTYRPWNPAWIFHYRFNRDEVETYPLFAINNNSIFIPSPHNSSMVVIDKIQGRQKTIFKSGRYSYKSPTILSEWPNCLYYCLTGNLIVAVDVNSNKVKWIFRNQGTNDIYCKRFLGRNNKYVYANIFREDFSLYFIYALDAFNGRLAWKYTSRDEITGMMAMNNSKICVLDAKNRRLRLIESASGKVLWSYNFTNECIPKSLAIAPDLIYISDLKGNMVAINIINGGLVWKHEF